MFELLKSSWRKRFRRTEASTAARDPKKIAVKRMGQALIAGGRAGEFEDSPVDLEEIGRAYYTDSYIRRAIDKQAGLLFKNGWELTSKNDAAVEYVWMRLKLMAEGTGQSIDSLLTEIGENLVLYSNVYLVKARAKAGQMAQGVTAVGYTGNQPVAGYFVLPPQLVRVQRDENGKILRYEQQNPNGGGEGVEFKPEDIIHITYKKPTGRAYGIPLIYNVMDDVKLLRQIEENVARLIYRNLFPLYLYKVGIDKPGFEATDEEIEVLREEIRNLPSDGALVVPERHDIKVVGSEGQAIDASGYLKYFRERVFSGLGVSDTIMGVSGTANKSTSDNQSADLNDSVKEFQRALADGVKSLIINELLFEGGFDPIVNVDDEVEFSFAEIEFDAKIKRENHVVQLFMQNAITFEELRQLLGMDIAADENRLHSNMFMKVDQGAANQGDNKDKPENQSGKKLAPSKPKKESLTEHSDMVTFSSLSESEILIKDIETFWADCEEDTVSRFKLNEDTQKVKNLTLSLLEESSFKKIEKLIESTYVKNYLSLIQDKKMITATKIKRDQFLNTVLSEARKDISRVIADTFSLLESRDKTESNVRSAYLSNGYRMKSIIRTVETRAINMSTIEFAINIGRKIVYVDGNEHCCDLCKTKNKEVKLSAYLDKDVPPHHPNCKCKISLHKK